MHCSRRNHEKKIVFFKNEKLKMSKKLILNDNAVFLIK